VAATSAFFALALAPALAVGQAAKPLDITAPVKSGSQCAPCHARIAESKRPGVIFSHASHLLLSCEACHWTAPHQAGGKTIRPPMESCFNCHGVRHGQRGEVAVSRCAACHTPAFNLRPATHSKTWKGLPHAKRAKQGENSCLMCHDPVTFCDECHDRVKPGLPRSQSDYEPVWRLEPRKPIAKILPDGPTTIGQCVHCHPDLDNFTPGRVIFAHAEHLRRSFACEACHTGFGHGPEETYRPTMPSCYACHALTHASAGTVATGKCEACHPKGFALKPPDHTPEFVAKTHRAAADKDAASCAMCHDPSFCTACHQGKPARPGGPARPKVIPADHRKVEFRKSHGGTYLAQQGACGSCHDSSSCERCHKTPMPHPADWTSSHALAKMDTTDCGVCHTDRSRCQECHHGGLRGAELKLENCVRCHPLMDTPTPSKIKNKGLAEHAVHFIVKEKKGAYYRCEECHIGFSAAAHTRSGQLTKGHDLRLCYECHGALDYQNRTIAPYPGNTLCLRCHSDLNL
jgi:hypothetical protein